MNTIIHYVYDTPFTPNIHEYAAVFAEAYKTGVLAEDFADLFNIVMLKGYNSDGTDRMVITAA